MKLSAEIYEEIAAKIVQKGEPDDLAKYMLSGKEPFEAVKRYFDLLEADKKKELTFKDDAWFFGMDGYPQYTNDRTYTGLALFKVVAPSIIPFVRELYIINTQGENYSFLGDIEDLHRLRLEFTDHEYDKVLLALSSLQSVTCLTLKVTGLNLQLLNSLAFSFRILHAFGFAFEANPEVNKVFQARAVRIWGDVDFVFTRENYQNYATIFPNATRLNFLFYMKIVDDVTDLLKVSNADHAAEVNIEDRNITYYYEFADYSGFPESKVLNMLQNDQTWHTDGCPYKHAFHLNVNANARVLCSFPLAINDVGERIGQNTLRRIPEDSDGNPEDYCRLIIDYERGKFQAEFDVLKTASVETLLKAYRELTGINHERFGFNVDHVNNGRWISDGTIADNFQNGDKAFFRYRHDL